MDAVFVSAFGSAVVAAERIVPDAPVEGVLRLLAAAPVGAVLPLEVLVAAVSDHEAEGTVGVGSGAVVVRDALAALGELVARAGPGSSTERVGPAHDLIAEYLVDRYRPRAVARAHLRLAETLRAMATARGVSVQVAAYAAARLGEHLWAAGRSSEALAALPELSTPADNIALWRTWHDRLESLGPDHPDVLITRANIATWTGQGGDPRRALRLFVQLLPDVQRVLGPDHPDVLTARGNIAFWTGEAGDPRRALQLFEQLLPDQQRVLGPDHPDVLATRANVALWTGGDDAEHALHLLEQLLPDQQRVLGPDHPDVLRTRAYISFWTGRTGDPQRALHLCQQLLADQQRVLGPDHPDVLRTRGDIATWTAVTGNPQRALHLFEKLLADQLRLLGLNHQYVLTTRSRIEGLRARPRVSTDDRDDG